MKIRLHNANKPLDRGSDLVLILGDGRSMPDDRDKFLSWGLNHDVGCIGRCIKAYPGHVHHWFNADGDTAIWWAKNLINGNGTIRHTLGPVDGFDVDWDMEQDDYHYAEITGESVGRTHGSSALFTVLACLEMGYKRIVLGGCPMDTNGHWYFDPKRETLGPIWLGMDIMAWLDFKKLRPDAAQVRSLSGYTAMILGEADKEWCNA